MGDLFTRYRISHDGLELLKNKIMLKEKLVFELPPSELMGFNAEVIADFYRVAYELFSQEKYEEAYHVFLFLTAIDSYNEEFWIGLGMSLQKIHAYERAIDAYELAALHGFDNPTPYFYLAKCFFSIHDRKNALESLTMAIEMAEDREEYQELKAQAMKAQQVLLHDVF